MNDKNYIKKIICEFIDGDSSITLFENNDSELIIKAVNDDGVIEDWANFGVHVDKIEYVKVNDSNLHECYKEIQNKINIISNKILDNYTSSNIINSDDISKRNDWVKCRDIFLKYIYTGSNCVLD